MMMMRSQVLLVADCPPETDVLLLVLDVQRCHLIPQPSRARRDVSVHLHKHGPSLFFLIYKWRGPLSNIVAARSGSYDDQQVQRSVQSTLPLQERKQRQEAASFPVNRWCSLRSVTLCRAIRPVLQWAFLLRERESGPRCLSMTLSQTACQTCPPPSPLSV